MKKLKQLLSVLIVSALIFSYSPFLSGLAETTPVEVGGSYELTLSSDSDIKTLTFTPSETAVYLFYSEAEEGFDPYFTIRDEESNEVLFCDDYYGSFDFFAGAMLTAGQTYSLNVYCHNEAGGSLTLYVAENIIESVSIDDVSIIVGTNTEERAYWDEETDSERYYNAYTYCVNGSVTLKEGGSATIEDNFVTIDGKRIEVKLNDNQDHENQWGIGTHHATTTVLGNEATFNVNIIESPVDSIYIEPITIFENTFCEEAFYWDEEEEIEKTWTCYSYSVNGSFSLKAGGSVNISDSFFDWNGSPYAVQYFDPQSFTSPWTVGSTYYVPVRVLGKDATLEVTIAPSPFSEITINDLSVGPQDLSMGNSYDDESGTWVDWDMYSYNVNGSVSLKEGGSIPIENNSFNYLEKTYTINIPDYGQDYKNPWVTSGTYPVSGEWLGISYSFNVTVTDSPVSSITLNDVVVYDKIDSYISYGYDEDADDYLPYNEFSIPVSGVISFNNGREDFFFNSSNFELDGDHVYCNIEHGQSLQNVWAVGGTYEVTATILGVSSTFNVTVKACPIKNIELNNVVVSADNYNVHYDYNEETDQHDLEYKNYYYCVNGTIYLNDGSTIPIEDDWFTWGDSSACVNVEDTQGYYSEWNEGGTYIATVYVCNIPTEIYVTVMPSPIKSFTVDNLELYEYAGGYNMTGWDPETQSFKEYFYYNYSLSGTVTLGNGRVINYTDGFFYANGKRYDVYLNDGQSYENPWTVGTHQAFASIEGSGLNVEVTVTVNPSPIDYIEADNLTLYKGLHNLTDMGYDYYSFTPSYVVHLKDGGRIYSDEYGYAALDEYTEFSLDIRDPQSEETPWDIGTHQVQFFVGGKEAMINVTIEDSPYTSVEISGTTDLTVTLYKENGDSDVFNAYYINFYNVTETSVAGDLLCNNGTVPNVVLSYEDSGFVNGLTLSVGGLESNTLQKNSFGRFSILNYNYIWSIASANYYSNLGLLPEFTTNINEMDIDTLCFLAAALTLDYPLDEFDIDETYYQIYSIEAIENSLLYNFGLEDVDLSSASGYEMNGKGTITILACYDGDLGDGDFDYTVDNNGWKLSFEAYEKDRIASITLDMTTEAVITSFDITFNTKGDLSGEGEIGTNDAILLLQYIAGHDVDIPLGLADINSDGVVDVGDAVLILQHVAGYNVGL